MSGLQVFSKSVAQPNAGDRRNEDAYLVVRHGAGVVAGVFDGVGGMRNGSDASMVAVEALRRSAENFFNQTKTETPEDFLKRIAKKINKEIRERYRKTASTTGCYGVFTPVKKGAYEVLIANIGDSRAYLLTSESALNKITNDDSLFPTFNDQLDLVECDADLENNYGLHLAFEHRNGITNALGLGADIKLYKQALNSGDSVIFTTDGIHDVLSKNQLKGVVDCCNKVPFSAERLGNEILKEVERQNERLGNVRRKLDDATIVIIHNPVR